MKKIILIVLFIICINNLFSQESGKPGILIELNTGYAIGINLPNAVPVKIKLVYPFMHFGLTFEGGILFDEDNGSQLFFGPAFFIINNPRIRVPISLGLDLCTINKSNYYGIGGIISFNYVFKKNMYFGANLSINYYLNNLYEEVTGYRDAAIGVVIGDDGNQYILYPMDNNGNPIKIRPIMEKKNHFGNYIHIKPTVSIGFQF